MGAAQLKPGDRVLINGASGGIGHLVLQMAKDAVGESGRVVAICSGNNLEMVKDLGADEVSALPIVPRDINRDRVSDCWCLVDHRLQCKGSGSPSLIRALFGSTVRYCHRRFRDSGAILLLLCLSREGKDIRHRRGRGQRLYHLKYAVFLICNDQEHGMAAFFGRGRETLCAGYCLRNAERAGGTRTACGRS
jgi:NADPH:quinone reductase-like Zn-dependent oxidoreductase